MSAAILRFVPQWNEDKTARLPTVPEMIYTFNRREDELIRLAMWAEQFAFNWRGANFGCAVLACRSGVAHVERFGAFPGWNFKTQLPIPEWREKLCAEIMGAKYAFDCGYYVIAGVVIYSTHLQQDDITGRSFKTPHPCWECTDRYQRMAQNFVRFVTVRPKLPQERLDPSDDGSDLVIERRNLAEIAHLHQHGEGP